MRNCINYFLSHYYLAIKYNNRIETILSHECITSSSINKNISMLNNDVEFIEMV